MAHYTESGSNVSIIMHDTLGVSHVTTYRSKLDVTSCFITP